MTPDLSYSVLLAGGARVGESSARIRNGVKKKKSFDESERPSNPVAVCIGDYSSRKITSYYIKAHLCNSYLHI